MMELVLISLHTEAAMRRVLILFALPLFCQPAHGQLRSGLLDSQTARRAGLEVMWSAQLRVDTRRGEMAGSALHVSSTEGTAVFEIMVDDKVVETITIDGTKFLLEGGTWLLYRKSGTEPVVRLYGESGSEAELEEILEAGKGFLLG